MKKKLISILLTLAILVGTSVSTRANEVYYTERDVDSNTYTKVIDASKSGYSKTATIKITNIYKADGSASNYKCVYCKATSRGTPLLIYSGSWYDIEIPSDKRDRGASVPLYAQGHDPRFDCKISGYWNVH